MSAQAKSVVPYSTLDAIPYIGSTLVVVGRVCTLVLLYNTPQDKSLCTSSNEFLSTKPFVLLRLYCSPEITSTDVI